MQWGIGCVGLFSLLSACGGRAWPNDHSVEWVACSWGALSQSGADSLLLLFQEGRICRGDIISLHQDSCDLVCLETKQQVDWIQARNFDAYEDSLRLRMPPEEKDLHALVWALPEMRQHCQDNRNRGMHQVSTRVYPSNLEGWYQVEIVRDYFYKYSPASPFGYLLVSSALDRIIVRDPVNVDLDLETWRAMDK
jgi:hypothetical protein